MELYEQRGRTGNDTAWVFFFTNDAISVEVQWAEEGGLYLDMSQSLASILFQVVGARGVGDERKGSHKNVRGWGLRQEVSWVHAVYGGDHNFSADEEVGGPAQAIV